jgi:hypothetical protein
LTARPPGRWAANFTPPGRWAANLTPPGRWAANFTPPGRWAANITHQEIQLYFSIKKLFNSDQQGWIFGNK